MFLSTARQIHRASDAQRLVTILAAKHQELQEVKQTLAVAQMFKEYAHGSFWGILLVEQERITEFHKTSLLIGRVFLVRAPSEKAILKQQHQLHFTVLLLSLLVLSIVFAPQPLARTLPIFNFLLSSLLGHNVLLPIHGERFLPIWR